jgi:hypothetical protein
MSHLNASSLFGYRAAAACKPPGEIRYFRPGDVLLVEDTTGKGHSAWTEGDNAFLAAAIQLPD